MPTLPPLGFGVATSSYQIEGAPDADGRGRSIWDEFCKRPDTVLDGSDGTVACDSYARFAEDNDLVAGLGVQSYRFSIGWPRIQPTGSGAVEARGLDHYEALVDDLLRRGLRPLPTLYHWDLPQPLEDAGGWPARDTALRFADYCAAVVNRLGDRVKVWSTLNEPWCSAFLGYAAGVHAPGRTEPEAAYSAAHHLLLGHALGAAAARATRADLSVGIVLNLAPVRPEPGVDPLAADLVDAVQNRLWLDALIDGSYPLVLVERSPALTTQGVVRDGDLAGIAGSADWLGVNYYTPLRPGSPDVPGKGVGQDSRAVPYAPSFGFHPRGSLTSMGWEVDPTGLTDILLTVAKRAPGVPLRVTENGASFPDDTTGPDGAVQDDDRVDYLQGHLTAVEQARAGGAPVLDYLAWSLLDNFEWAQGYTQTFGLVSVEPQNLRRVPKRSYHWFADHVAQSRAR